MIESSPRVDHPSFPVFRVELRGDRSAVIHPENGQITLAAQPQPPEHAQSPPPPAVTRRKPSARTLAREEVKRQKRKEDYERNKEEKKVRVVCTG